MSKRIVIVLSGCGVHDGSDIHEATLTLLALVKAGATPIFAAPDIPQAEVTNHLVDVPQAGEKRGVLVESARIARGQITPLGNIHVGEIDGAIFPGGYGVVKNLCNFAARGAACEVNPEVARLIRNCHAANKPLGFICIAPVLAARVLGGERLRVQLTIGYDHQVAQAITAMGGTHLNCPVDDVLIDEANNVLSTPAYMLARSIAEAEVGITKLVSELLKRCRREKLVATASEEVRDRADQ